MFVRLPVMPGRAGVLRIEPPAASRPVRTFIADACALRLPGHSQTRKDGDMGAGVSCCYLIRNRLNSLAKPMAYSSELVKSA